MFKWNGRLTAVIICVVVVSLPFGSVFAAGRYPLSTSEKTFLLEEAEVSLPAYEIEGETYVPVQASAQIFNAYVEFDSEKKTVNLNHGDSESAAAQTALLLELVKDPERRAVLSPHRLHYGGGDLGADLIMIDGYNFISLEVMAGYFGYYTVLEEGTKMLITKDGLKTVSEEVREAYRSYLAANAFPIDSENTSVMEGAGLDGYKVYLVGEGHATSSNYDMNLFFTKYFYENYGIRHILMEYGYSDTKLLEEYHRSGDEEILKELLNSYQGSASYTKDLFEFHKKLYEYNRSLPEDGKLVLLGVDVQHNTNVGIKYALSIMADLADAASGQTNADVSQEAAAQIVRDGIEALKAVSNRQAFYAFIKSVEANEEAYRAVLGDRYTDFDIAIEGIRQRLVYGENENSYEVREGFIHQNVERVYREHDIDKAYGMFGSAHVNLSGSFGSNPNMAAYMNNRMEETKGKVCAILINYKDSYYLDPNSGEVTPMPETYSGIIGEYLAAPSGSSFILYPLTNEGSPFIDDGSLGSGTHILEMKNSAAAQPYE